MIVMKFGGTSLGDQDRLRGAALLVKQRLPSGPVVVVSAVAGVTDRLLTAAGAAESGESETLAASLAWIRERHEGLLTSLFPSPPQDLRRFLDETLAALEDLTHGISLVRECSPRSRDAVGSIGEVLAHRLFAAVLETEGVPSLPVDPRALVPTDDAFGEAQVDLHLLARNCEEQLSGPVGTGVVPVTGGHVGGSPEGAPTTFGRGGSDLSATLLGAALDAEEVQIWTDVDGLMTADPRVVAGARPLREVSYQAAQELAYFGARVLHPATLRPAIDAGMPVRVLNSHRPDAPGTTIRALPDEELPPGGLVRAVAWKRDIATVAVSSSRMLGAHGFLAEIFGVFDRNRTPVDVVTTSELSVSMTVERVDRLDRIAADLGRIGRVSIARDMALVCLVGRQLLEHPRLVGEILGELEGIPLRMFCLGSSDLNLTLVVANDHAEEVVRRLHARFLENPA